MVGGVPGRVHLVGGVECREVDLKLVIIFSVKLHLFKSVSPQYLTRKIRCSEKNIELVPQYNYSFSIKSRIYVEGRNFLLQKTRNSVIQRIIIMEDHIRFLLFMGCGLPLI